MLDSFRSPAVPCSASAPTESGCYRKHFDVPFWLGLPAGGVAAAAIGLVLVFPSLRLTGIYLAIATLAFAQCALWVMVHWTSVTFGASGFTLKGADFSSVSVSSENGMYYLSWVCCVLLLLAARNIVHSRLGRAFVAMRDHQISAQSTRYRSSQIQGSGVCCFQFLCGHRRRAVRRYASFRRSGEFRPPSDDFAARGGGARRNGFDHGVGYRRCDDCRPSGSNKGHENLDRNRIRCVAAVLRVVRPGGAIESSPLASKLERAPSWRAIAVDNPRRPRTTVVETAS